MKKSKMLKIALLLCAAAALLTVGIFGAVNMEKITAYRNYDIDIKYDGVSQVMTDANGTRVYPITIDGTTYLPIRAVSNMMGVNVLWDQASYSVLLGKTGMEQNLLEINPPYATGGGVEWHRSADNKSRTIAGKAYDQWVSMYNGKGTVYFDLGGQYDTLTFDTYSERDCTVKAFGDNGVLLLSVDINAYLLPKTYSIDVTGVSQIVFTSTSGGYSYLFNMFVK